MPEYLYDKYNRPVPRYTSYPTAPQFSEAVGPDLTRGWLGEIPADEAVSLYIHVPFCRKLCYFCGCNMKVVNGNKAIEDYVGTLLQEIEQTAGFIGRRQPVSHLHWGGGTPSVTPPELFAELMRKLNETFEILPEAEQAIELDPRVLDAEIVKAYAATGLNRASIGVQDFDLQVQEAINRVQPYEMTAQTVDWLRDNGITGINFDLIYGLPNQTLDTMKFSVDCTVEIKPTRVALFGYAHVPWMKKHQKLLEPFDMPNPEQRQEMFDVAAEMLGTAGYVRVGYDHFALPEDSMAVAHGHGELHRNFQGFTVDPAEVLVNLGSSAIGTLRGGYVQNHPTVQGWRNAIERGEPATAKGVKITAQDRLRRQLIERVMCDYKVDVHAVCAHMQMDVAMVGEVWEKLEALEGDGMVVVEGGVVRVTEAGAPFVRIVASCFDQYFTVSENRHAKAV